MQGKEKTQEKLFVTNLKHLVYRRFRTSAEKQSIIEWLRIELKKNPALEKYVAMYRVGEVHNRKDANDHILTTMQYL